MFKMAKYYVLVNIYRKARINIMLIFISLMMMVSFSYLFADLALMEGYTGYLMTVKWIIYFMLLTVIVWNVKKMQKIAILPFGNENVETVVDDKKEHILQKEQLFTRSELIVNKYRSEK